RPTKAIAMCMTGWRPAARCIGLSLALMLVEPISLSAAPDGDAALARAQALIAAGDLRAALTLLDNAETLAPTATTAMQVDRDLMRVDLLRRLGKLTRAEQALSQLQEEHAGKEETGAAFMAQLRRQRALLHFRRGAVHSAENEIQSALQLEDQLTADVQASLLNDLAVIRQRAGDPADAIAQFSEAARRVGGGEDELVYRLNAARAMLEDGRVEASIAQARQISQMLEQLSPGETVRHRIALAQLYREAVNTFGADAGLRLAALQLLQGAAGNTAVSQRSRSLVDGHIAELYSDDRQFNAAVMFARSALSRAARAGAGDLEYRWEWVLARAFTALDDADAAIAAYGRAIASLRDLRSNLELFDRDTLDDVIKPLYYAYANLMLRRSAELPGGAEKQEQLGAVREALEELKQAEVQDYFREQCVGEEKVALDQLAVDTVVLYPVMLKDRLELLLSTESGIQQIAVAVERDTLVEMIRDFRLNIEANNGTDDYLRQAQQLYRWLIAPLETALARQQIDTVVFVPDGPLRTIPLAALHDGKSFLIERFAVATAPGLTLIEPMPLTSRSYPTLAAGISQSVQGFPALPGVDRELASLRGRFDATVIDNRAFTRARAQEELRSGDYSIVHFATHGQFGDSYETSFLLTYDSKLLINELGNSIQSGTSTREPLELLVLSACETAAGDDRAALGLAGVALKAGARSALATLWEVDDQSTLRLIEEFYASLPLEGSSRARSLQRAQMTLIRSSSSSQPSHWAPFLLIGNWV
ncbi:MAG: CHAT domain-containing protein, partial [Chromatocurvus sp.]